MSYVRKNKSDALNEYFTALTDFSVLSPRLLNADSEHNFIMWFEKLWLIDSRALFFFIRKHKDELSPEYVEWAQEHYETRF